MLKEEFNMKKYVYLLLLVLGVTSCGSLQDLSIEAQTNCLPRFQHGVYGFGYYNCYGQLLHAGPYNFNGFTNGYGYGSGYGGAFFGPRIVIRSGGGNNTTSTVKGGRGERVTTGTPRRGNTGGGKNTHKVRENTRLDSIHAEILYPDDIEKQTSFLELSASPSKPLINNGAALFFKYCSVCHLNGIGGAPHPTDMKLDMNVALNGRNAMPPMSHLGEDALEDIFNYIEKLQK